MIPRIRQPLPGEPTRILSGHPLARGLVTALCFNQTGYTIANAVTGRLAGTVTTPAFVNARRVSPFGVSLGTEGATAATTIGVTLSSPGWSASADASIEVLVSVRAAPNSTSPIIISNSTFTGLYAENVTLKPWMYPASKLSVGLTAGAWTSIAITRSAAGVVRYFINGVFVEQAGTGTTLAFNPDAMFLDTFSEDINASVDHVHIWNNRLLSDGEIYDQFINPYAIYEPSLLWNTLYHYPSGAAGVTYPRLERGIRGLNRGVAA